MDRSERWKKYIFLKTFEKLEKRNVFFNERNNFPKDFEKKTIVLFLT